MSSNNVYDFRSGKSFAALAKQADPTPPAALIGKHATYKGTLPSKVAQSLRTSNEQVLAKLELLQRASTDFEVERSQYAMLCVQALGLLNIDVRSLEQAKQAWYVGEDGSIWIMPAE